MTPEEFDQLDAAKKSAAIDYHNEEVRQWVAKCIRCGFKNIGTLKELRGKPCGACGYV